MDRPRTSVLGLVVGVLLGGYLVVWLHLPPFVGVGAAAVTLVVILILAAAIGGDPEASDLAWREAAPDLAGRRPEEPGPFEPARWTQPRPARAGGPVPPSGEGPDHG